MKKIKNKIISFLKTEKGKRFAYEVKSFSLTFVSTLAFITGITSATEIGYLIDNKDMIIGSLSLAFSRSVVIYIFAKVGLSYRSSTIDYK